MKFRFCFGLSIASAVIMAGCTKGPSSAPSPVPSNGAPTSPGASAAAAPATVKPPFDRPTLEAVRGQYFSYSMPSGWKAAETANGVDMTSPDGKLIASSVLLAGTPGSSTPWGFVQKALTVTGTSNVKLVHSKDLPSQKSGYPGINWTIQELEATCVDKDGVARHAAFTCGICNAYGSYSAILQTFSAPDAEYVQVKTWLPLLVESVQAIDPSKVAYQDKVLLPQNHPLDNSALMESWQARRQSQDRIDQKQHETTMGYERMVSPIDGKHYNMPFETYDGTAGGYRDPADRNQVLKHASPGE